MAATLPFDNLGYPVLLSLDHGKSFGSGFRFKFRGLNLVVAARHVLFDENGELKCQNLIMTCQEIIVKKMMSHLFEIDLKKVRIEKSDNADVAIIGLVGSTLKQTSLENFPS